ncbi:MAG: YitT family protein [Lentihominibacter sp.]|nr:YitT family protein [Clostridiales bacterium]MDY2680812.1 YitT family protein [Lentihominibacter sp.]
MTFIRKTGITRQKIKELSADFAVLLAACCISSFSTVAVMIPNGLTSGGLTGIVRIMQNFIDADFSVLYYGCTGVVLIMVIIFLGWREFRKILMLSVMYPAVLFLFEQLNFQLLEERDVILAAVFCGVFSGTYIGLVFWKGYASAGTEAIARIIRKKLCPDLSMSRILLCVDAAIIVFSAFVFGRNIAMYALITQVIITRVSEMIIYGFTGKVVQLSIITSEHEGIKKYILEDLDRGVSSIRVTGEYTQTEFMELTVMCSLRESVLIRKKIAVLDPDAFVVVTKVEAVWGHGKGFSDIDKD